MSDALPTTLNEIVNVEENEISLDKIPNNELKVDVLLATDSSGSHKQYQNKDIDIDSRNINVGKLFLEEFVTSKVSIFFHSTRWISTLYD